MPDNPSGLIISPAVQKILTKSYKNLVDGEPLLAQMSRGLGGLYSFDEYFQEIFIETLPLLPNF